MLGRTRIVVAALLIGLAASYAVAAADLEEAVELRARLEQHFDILPLSDGVLLSARNEENGPRAVEVSSGEVALDGQTVGSDELRARLGDEVAELVLAVAELEETARQEMLLQATVEEEAVVVESIDEEPESAADRAEAQRQQRPGRKRKYRRSGDSEVAFAGNLTVDRDEVTEDVLVVGGFLKIEGRVDGDATVIGGSATIEGEVTGEVTAIGGPVRLEDGSRVHGDVTSVGGQVYQDDGARVDGDIEQVPFSADFSFGPWSDWKRWEDHGRSHDFDFQPWRWWTGVGWGLVKLLFLAGLAWLSLLLAKTPIERMERRVAAEPWKTGLVGLLAQVLFIPMLVMLVVFLAISIIGIPLLLVLPFALLALAIVGWFGFVAVAGRVGNWAEDHFGWQLGSPFWVVLLGFAAIAALSIVGDLLNFGVAPMRFIAGMFIFFGAIVSWAAWTIGCGAAVLTRFGTADSWNRADEIVEPLPPLPGYDDGGDPAGAGEPEADAFASSSDEDE